MDTTARATKYGLFQASEQGIGTAELTPIPPATPKAIGPQDKTVVRRPAFAILDDVSAFEDRPPHFREDDLLQDPLLWNVERTPSHGRLRPTLGGIPLLANLGKGGMGSVYYAFHPRLKMEVAVKVLSAELAQTHPDLVHRFQQEAQIAARVRSPHLATVIDVNQCHGLHYLVMEYIHGPSADQYMRQQKAPLPEAWVLDLCAAACEGLQAAHAAGIVHRDVKPANILLPAAPGSARPHFKEARLADLGIARLADQNSRHTQASTPMGSPGYMAPEQVLDSSRATRASDVFGMGATLYALLTRRAPFARSSYAAALIATVNEPIVPVRQFRSDVTPATAAMIARCLSKQPEERYPDAAALLREIRVCRAALTVSEPEQAEIANRIERDARLSCSMNPAVVDAGRKLVVISVEDNEIEQQVMKHYFKKLPWDLELYQVATAEDALGLFQRTTPDIILTDVCMPAMDGFEFVEKIRAQPKLKLTPIIVKSAITEDVGKYKSLHIGADAYLEKPVKFEVLERTLGRMIARLKAQPAARD